jgi:predicted permease
MLFPIFVIFVTFVIFVCSWFPVHAEPRPMLTRLRVFVARLGGLVEGRRREAELAEEIRAHLGRLESDYVARGLAPADARLAARRAFGRVDRVTETCRDQRGFPLVADLRQDIRFAARLFAREWRLSVATVAALAVGMGGTATMLSIVYSLNLRELPFESPAALVAVRGEPNRAQRGQVPFAVFEGWRTASTKLSAMGAHVGGPVNLGDETRATDRLSGTYVSSNVFAILRERPVLGRDFEPEDDRRGAPRVAIVGYRVWTDRYGSDPAIVGRTVRTNGETATIVGVMPNGFSYPIDTQIWLPLAALPAMSSSEAGGPLVQILARLADGASIEQARGELAAIASTLATVSDADRRRQPLVLPLNEAYVGAALQTTPVMLIAATLVVLLMACSHAASLLVARSAARLREIALRAALGASRARLVRQLLIESITMALAAGLLAMVMASIGMRAFANETAGAGIPYWTRFTLDVRLFSVLAVLSALVGLGFGLLPALQLSGVDLGDVLSQGGRSGTPAPGTQRTTAVLLIGEMALTVVLLASAGALVQSANVVYRADRTMDLGSLWEYRLDLPQPEYASKERRLDFYRRLDERLAAAPATASAALASGAPFISGEDRGILMDDEAAAGGAPLPTARFVTIGPRYFETLDIRLVAGRSFDQVERSVRTTSALVNERFAERFSPGADPIGRQLLIVNERAPGSAPLRVTVIGIAPLVRQDLNTGYTPVVYVPHEVEPAAAASIIIRGEPDRFAEVLRQEVRRLDPDLPLFRLQSLERASYISRWIPRIFSLVFSIVAMLATALSALGLYSITAFAASQRTREMGVRMALGAERHRVIWLFLRRVVIHVGVSLAIGLAGAVAAGVVLEALLVDVRAGSPLLLAQVAGLVVTVSMAATLLPALRAARLDPVDVLRHE